MLYASWVWFAPADGGRGLCLSTASLAAQAAAWACVCRQRPCAAGGALVQAIIVAFITGTLFLKDRMSTSTVQVRLFAQRQLLQDHRVSPSQAAGSHVWVAASAGVA